MWARLPTLLLTGAVLALSLRPATSLAAAEKTCRFADDAPASYDVVRGDTLWDLASRFLRDPWCWPDMWESNHDAVANPHLIYPGQQLRLDRVRGLLIPPRDDDGASALPVVRLAPAMRAEAIPALPVPLIASSWLSLLQKTPLMSAAELARAPQVVALPGDRRMAGAGDLIYVRSKPGGTPPPLSGELRRPLAPVIDPESGKPIALATRRIGRAEGMRAAPDGLQPMRVTEASEEVMSGDLLVMMPQPSATQTGLMPHAASGLRGRVAAILQERRWATVHDIVVLNRGTRHGIDAGSVVSVVRPVRIGSHEALPDVPTPTAIDAAIATLLVVDVLEHAALAIVMRAQEPFSAGAAVSAPDRADR